MTILATDIKLRQSQRLTDNPDGGGRMVSAEIVDGALNNLFPDIDDEARTTGQVSLRKLFVHIDTPGTDVLAGAIAVILSPPEDPNVSMSMFATGSYSDERTQARNRVESFITRGVESRLVLMGAHYIGARAITAYCLPDAPTPDVNETLCLSTETAGYGDDAQYVRVESVVSRTRQTFYDATGAFERDVVVLGITTPLLYDFFGQEPVRFTAAKPPTRIRLTNVVDAASYYSIRALTDDAASGALAVKVQTPYVPLVPATQAETPVVDVPAGLGAVAVIPSGDTDALSISTSATFSAGVGVVRFFGSPVARGTAKVIIGATVLLDDGAGGLAASGSSAWRGSVDYVGGSVTVINDSGAGATAFTASATPAGVISMQGYTSRTDVGAGNQQLNYVATLVPPPAPGTVTYDYMALGKWIRLSDNGAGQLVGASGQGSGNINYSTGSLVVTLGALPDIGSAMIRAWGTGVATSRRAGDTSIQAPYLSFTLPDEHIKPGTYSVTWKESGVDKTATDNGAGVLVKDSTPVGTIVYRTGEVGLRPSTLPDGATQLVSSYTHSDSTLATLTPVPDSNGFVSFTLPDAPLRAGSLRFEWLVAAAAPDATTGATPVPLLLVAKDDGAGNLVGVSAGGAALGGTLGTVNYTSGAVTLKAHGVTVGTAAPANTPSAPGFGVPTYGTSHLVRRRPLAVARVAVNSSYTAGTPIHVSWQSAGAADTVVSALGIELPPVAIDLTPTIMDDIVPGSVRFTFRGRTYVDRNGSLYYDVDPANGAGTYAGTIDYTSGIALLTQWVAGGSNTATVVSMLTRIADVGVDEIDFRSPGAPLRPGSFTVTAVTLDGEQLTGTADINGDITGDSLVGTVDWTTGAAYVRFGELVTAAGHESESWYLAENVVAGQIWRPRLVISDSIYFGTVIYRSIPLSPVVIGLDPVRLPSDGRVVAFKPGQTVVVHNTGEISLSSPSPGQVVNCGRTNLSMVEVVDGAGTPVDSVWYTINLDAGTVAFASPLVLSAYTMPIKVRHMIADRRLVADVQISGEIALNTGLSRAFPAGSYISTALRLGEANGSLNLQARVQGLFDQAAWTNVWSDERIGDAAGATYNDIDFPLAVTNADCITERWAIIFTSSTSFRLVGEAIGQIATGSTASDFAPVNPRTGQPCFTLDKDGWGGGWAVGNVVRFNTVGALAPVWVARTVLAGEAGASPDGFRLRVIGNITGGGA